MMTLKELRNYENWIDKSPVFVLASARSAGGWGRVFPSYRFDHKCFLWAHRVRNYFNELPHLMRRTPQNAGLARAIKQLTPGFVQSQLTLLSQLAYAVLTSQSLTVSDILTKLALNPLYVYEDPTGRTWYQMAEGGTIYHWHPNPSQKVAVMASLAGQEFVPIFKFVAPDGSDGSSEAIVTNPQVSRYAWYWGILSLFEKGERTLGDVSDWVPVTKRLVTDNQFFGSYNYSETAVTNFEEHKLRDIEPHERYPDAYIHPAESNIAARRFPATYRGKPIADCLRFPD